MSTQSFDMMPIQHLIRQLETGEITADQCSKKIMRIIKHSKVPPDKSESHAIGRFLFIIQAPAEAAAVLQPAAFSDSAEREIVVDYVASLLASQQYEKVVSVISEARIRWTDDVEILVALYKSKFELGLHEEIPRPTKDGLLETDSRIVELQIKALAERHEYIAILDLLNGFELSGALLGLFPNFLLSKRFALFDFSTLQLDVDLHRQGNALCYSHLQKAQLFSIANNLTSMRAESKLAVECGEVSDEGYFTFGTACLRAADFQSALLSFQKATSIADKVVYRRSAAISLLHARRFREAWPIYEETCVRLAIPQVPRIRSLSEFRGNALYVVFYQGIGDAFFYLNGVLAALQHLNLADRNVYLLVDSRIPKLCSSPMPRVDLIERPDNLRGLAGKQDAQINFLDAVREVWDSEPKLKITRSFLGHELRPNAGFDAFPPGARLRIGLSGFGGGAVADFKSLSLNVLLSLVPERIKLAAEFFDVSYRCINGDREFAMKSHGVEIKRPDIDFKDDLLGTYEFYRSLDFIVSVSNSNLHLAANAGVPCLMVTGAPNTLPYWQVDSEGRSISYPNVLVHTLPWK